MQRGFVGMLLFRMVWNKVMLYHHCFRICHQECPRKQRDWNWMGFWPVLMLLIYWWKHTYIIKKHIDALLHARKEIHLQVNAKNQMHVHVLSPQTGTKYIKATNEYMKKCKNSNIWETSKKSELHTHGNSEQTKFQECLLPCTSESLIFLCAI
jgi:hypothetical protein